MEIAIGEHVLIKQDNEAQIGKIVFLNNERKRPSTGTVLSVGELVTSPIMVGDRVRFNENLGRTTDDGLLIVNFHGIFTKFE